MTDRTSDTQTRDGTGKWDKDPEAAKRTAKALELRQESRSYRQIADALGVSTSTAYDMVQRGLRETVEEPAEAVRSLELAKLDALEREALEVALGDHVIVSAGRVTDIPDVGPKLAALQLLMRLGESRRKLLGLDQPAKVTVDGGVRYEVVGVDLEKLT
jgi:hypothetical protein